MKYRDEVGSIETDVIPRRFYIFLYTQTTNYKLSTRTDCESVSLIYSDSSEKYTTSYLEFIQIQFTWTLQPLLSLVRKIYKLDY